MAELAATLTATEADRLEQAQAAVRSYCGWHIAKWRTGVQYVVPEYTRVVVLPSLRVTGVSIANSDGEAVSEDDYIWTAAGVVTSKCGWWPRGTTITYSHGYDSAPADVTGVVQALASRAIGSQSGRTVSSQSAGTVSVSFDALGGDGFLPSERAVLDRYKLPSRP